MTHGSRRIEHLTVAQFVELRKRLFRTSNSSAPAVPPLRAQPRARRIPLSPAQERLWLLDLLGTVGSAYNLPIVLRFEGALDLEILSAAFTEIIRRHESLRTRIEMQDGEPLQVIDPPSRFEVRVLELTDRGGEACEREAQHAIEQESERAFDLATGPLLRAAVLRLSADEFVLLITMHHVVSDGWSIGVLLRELSALYRAFSQGLPSPLPELDLQYADYAIWQRSWLKGELLQEQVEYWKQRLAGAPPALELPADHARPAIASFRGATLSFALPSKLSASVRELAKAEGVTLYMLLLAAYQVLLSRWCGQNDIVVGTPIAGRTHVATEPLIGFFVNALVMRTKLSRGQSFWQLLQDVKEIALGAYARQDMPYEKLLEILQPVRHLDRAPIFQTTFSLHNVPPETIALPGARLLSSEREQVTAKLDVSLYMLETEVGLRGWVEYSTDLFERQTIERLARCYEVILAAVVENVSAPIDTLPVLGAVERRRVLDDWNDTAARYPADKCVHELFEEQVRRTPDAVALVFEGTEISYRRLDQLSNQLAHHLRGLGVGPDSIVGLCVRRSAEMVTGIIGVLKAGGAYLPLDPDYPPERLAFMLQDSGVSVVVSYRASVVEQLDLHRLTHVRLDADRSDISRAPDTTPACITHPDNLSHVLYTSGSTGTPKAVMGTHRVLVNRLSCDGGAEHEVYAQKTTLNFIDAVWEIFMPLMRGQRTLVVPAAAVNDPTLLVEMLASHGVTRIATVPSLLRAMLENATDLETRLAKLRYWPCGGEPVDSELAREFARCLPGARLVNVYGTTECWDACCYEVGAAVSGEGVPIGRPYPNTRLYVLDDALEPVPIGSTGELYVAGDNICRGYLRRPGLTAERFIANPFGRGERLYATRDLVRYQANGVLDYIGRRDHQVKIRGYRIELHEVEMALLSHDAVSQAVVLVTEGPGAEKRLVGYVVPQAGRMLEPATLRETLRQRLPEYMVPAVLMVLERLPVTANGKLDRAALPVPDPAAQLQHQYVPPRTPTEQALAGIWAQVLRVERVGIHDDFFELGGQSLLAARVTVRVRETLHVDLEMRAFFQTPTIRALAEHLDIRLWARQRAEPGGVADDQSQQLERGVI